MGDCGPPVVIQDSTNNWSDDGFFPELMVAYDCNIGYRAWGTTNIYTCNGTHWIGEYYCQQITCKYVYPPENGVIYNNPTYEIGTYIKFACNSGYIIKGHRSDLCMSDGYWDSKTVPVCEPVNCGEFKAITNGRHFFISGEGPENSYNRKVKVECDDRYILYSPTTNSYYHSSNIVCNEDGNWGDNPVCVLDTCITHPGIENSSCVDYVDMSSSGQLIDLYCREDVSVTVIGDGSAYCDNSVWSDLNIACHCDCRVNFNNDLMEIRNLNEKGYLPHESSLDWECKNNGTKTTTKTLVCLDGVMPTPVCKDYTTEVVTKNPLIDPFYKLLTDPTPTMTTAPSIKFIVTSITTTAPRITSPPTTTTTTATTTTTTTPATTIIDDDNGSSSGSLNFRISTIVMGVISVALLLTYVCLL